jgi:hypothetical protein
MAQLEKLDNIILKVLKEELDSSVKEEKKQFITKDGTSRTLTPDQINQLRTLGPGDTATYMKPGERQSPTASESEEIKPKDEAMRTTPSSTEISGKIAEMIDSLRAVSEGSEDPKVHKIAEKASAQLEVAKKTLESLTAHEVMLQEKEHEKYVKEAAKKRKVIEKYLKKTVKMPEVVEKLMKKLPDEKVADMMKKSKGELDEEKVAGAMMRVALRESYIPTDAYVSEEDSDIDEDSVKLTRDELKYLDQKQRLLSPARRAEIVKSKKEKEEKEKQDKDVEVPREVPKNLDNKHNKLISEIDPSFYLSKKPYNTWGKNDRKAFEKIVSAYTDNTKKYLTSLKKESETVSLPGGGEVNIAKKLEDPNVKDKPLSETIPVSDMKKYIKYKNNKPGAIDKSEASKIESKLASHFMVNHYPLKYEPARAKEMASQDIKNYLSTQNIGKPEEKAVVGALLNTINNKIYNKYYDKHDKIFSRFRVLMQLAKEAIQRATNETDSEEKANINKEVADLESKIKGLLDAAKNMGYEVDNYLRQSEEGVKSAKTVKKDAPVDIDYRAKKDAPEKQFPKYDKGIINEEYDKFLLRVLG